MPTLLILGSKPEPVLPPPGSFDALACANASGYSAKVHGLPVPAFTIISAILTSGIESGQQSMRALEGLETDVLYYFPRPDKSCGLLKRLRHAGEEFRASPWYFRRRLKQASYSWNRLVEKDNVWYQGLVASLCKGDSALLEQIGRKSPSTGIMTLAVGMSLGMYDRFILSGFSFELTHAYADNPEIQARGTVSSRHTPSDILVLQYLSKTSREIFTSEPAVHERTGVPMVDAVTEH